MTSIGAMKHNYLRRASHMDKLDGPYDMAFPLRISCVSVIRNSEMSNSPG